MSAGLMALMPQAPEAAPLSYLMSAVLARDIPDESFALCGMHGEIGLAACLLAQRTHAPNLSFQLDGGGIINPRLARVPHTVNDWRLAEGAEAIVSGLSGMWNLSRPRLTFEFFGGLEVDRFGNLNLIAVPGLRGPGAAAGTAAARYAFHYVYMHRHDRRSFVEAVHHVSAPGNLRGAAERAAAGLLGAGPRLVVSPLGVFDFSGPDGSMNVVSLHPGVDSGHVTAQTGFALASEGAPVTPPLTDHEYEILLELDDGHALSRVVET
jgi:glutaconate CoA-transferase subunit B